MLKEIMMKVVKIIGYSILGLFLVAITLEIFGTWHDEWSGYNASLSISDGECNIAVIPVHGEILEYENQYGTLTDDSQMTSPEDIRMSLSIAENDPLIKGVLLRLDSLGGSPAGSEAIADRVKTSTLPTAVLVGDYATSAGYLIATGANTIIASHFSDVGSIGVTMSYLENIVQNENDGLAYVPLASAPYKDYMNPNKALTVEERALLERDLQIYHDVFVDFVAKNRNLPKEDVAKLADGSSMPASLALEKKLIDQIGNAETVRTWFAEKLGMPIEEVILCE